MSNWKPMVNRGGLLVNANKKLEKHPDFSGVALLQIEPDELVCRHCGCLPNGPLQVERNVAAWLTQTHQGANRVSLAFSLPLTPEQQAQINRSGAGAARAACADPRGPEAMHARQARDAMGEPQGSWGVNAADQRAQPKKPPVQPDLVQQAEAISRDRADFDDEIPF